MSKEFIQAINQRARDLLDRDLEALMDEIRRYLEVGSLLPSVVSFESSKTVRKAQKALSIMGARLDRIVAIHHDAKRVLQIISMIEHQLIGYLTKHSILPIKSTGPQQNQTMFRLCPVLFRAKDQWSAVDSICTQAQQRLSSARESIKLQVKLDDNLRWAQERSPG